MAIRNKSFFGVAFLFLSLSCWSIEKVPIVWQSPDKSISVALHNGWEKNDVKNVKMYNQSSIGLIIPDSFFRLYTGGLFPRRYINLQIMFFDKVEGVTAEALLKYMAQKAREKGLIIVREYYQNSWRGFIQYRFVHTGREVSQVVAIISTETGFFHIETTALREDENILRDESLQVFSSVSILRLPKG